MPVTKRKVNWANVGFTPTGGSLLSATGVTQVQVNPNGSVIKFSGDGDHSPTTIVNDFVDNEIVVTSADIDWIASMTPGTRGVLTATNRDAKGAVGGSIVYTLANAIVVDNPNSGQHRQFSSGTVRFNAESSDGTTDPLSFTTV